MSFTADDIKDAPHKVIGTKQTLKSLEKDEVEALFLASDAEERVVSPLVKLCEEKKIEFSYAGTMSDLGRLAGIKVGAAAVAIIKP